MSDQRQPRVLTPVTMFDAGTTRMDILARNVDLDLRAKAPAVQVGSEPVTAKGQLVIPAGSTIASDLWLEVRDGEVVVLAGTITPPPPPTAPEAYVHADPGTRIAPDAAEDVVTAPYTPDPTDTSADESAPNATTIAPSAVPTVPVECALGPDDQPAAPAPVIDHSEGIVLDIKPGVGKA